MKPMLACGVESDELQKLTYPLLAQPKFDGIRCLLLPSGEIVSRSLKPIPNRCIQRILSKVRTHHILDGEIMLRNSNVFQEITSAVMTEDGEPDFVFNVFDSVFDGAYLSRSNYALSVVEENPEILKMVESTRVMSAEDVIQLHGEYLNQGYEGLILRAPMGSYKFGRSTLKQQWLLKYKHFVDKEFVIIGYEEKLHNGNEATKNALGHTERSSHKANMIPMNTLGMLIVKDPENPAIQFGVGTGFTDEQRHEIWSKKDTYLGKFLKVKYFPIGMKESTGIPRFPVALGIRDPRDM